MKKILQKFITKLYLKFCEPDIVGMTRKQLGLFDNAIDIEKMSRESRDKYYTEAQVLLNNDVLNNILNELVDGVKDNVWYHLDDELIGYERFSLNGLHLVKERIELYATQAPKKVDGFDEFEIV